MHQEFLNLNTLPNFFVFCREVITFEMLCLEIREVHTAIFKPVFSDLVYHTLYNYIYGTHEMPAFEKFPSFVYNPVRILPQDNLSTSLKIWQTMLYGKLFLNCYCKINKYACSTFTLACI